MIDQQCFGQKRCKSEVRQVALYASALLSVEYSQQWLNTKYMYITKQIYTSISRHMPNLEVNLDTNDSFCLDIFLFS